MGRERVLVWSNGAGLFADLTFWCWERGRHNLCSVLRQCSSFVKFAEDLCCDRKCHWNGPVSQKSDLF